MGLEKPGHYAESVEAAGIGENDRWYYTYDLDRRRVRKVRAIVTDADTAEEVITVGEERIYLGDWETWRSYFSGELEDAIESRHVRDEQRRIAILETRTMEDGDEVEASTWRLQLDDHLGTACVETTLGGGVLSYEEFHPYGATAFRCAAGENVSSKRYRYTSAERDEETGFSYHHHRYYVTSVSRWASVDPKTNNCGGNLYEYAWCSPVCVSDATGQDPPDLDVPPNIEFSEPPHLSLPNPRQYIPPTPSEDTPRSQMVLGASNVTVHTIGTPAEGYRISTTIAQPDGGATLSPGVSVEWRKGSASPGEDLIPIYWDITIDLSLVVSYFYDEDAAKHEKMHERGHVDAKNAIGQAPYVAKMLAGGRLYAPGVDDPNRQFAQLERVDFPSKISLADSDAPKRLDEYELKLESYISRTMYYGDKLLTHTNPQKTLVGYTDRDQVPYEKMPDGTVRLKDQPPVAPRFRTE